MCNAKVEQISEEDIKKVLGNFNKKGDKIANNKSELSDLVKKVEGKINAQATGPIGDMLDNVKLLVSLIKDYIKGNYKTIAIGSIVVIVGALLHFISPLDIIPDVVPVVGSIDDIMVLGFAMTQIAADLASYREWKEQQIVSSEVSE